MRRTALNLVIMAMLVATVGGCALGKSLMPASNLKNHALAANGATIRMIEGGGYQYTYYYDGLGYVSSGVNRGEFGENPRHEIGTLVNGNCSSEDWINGEGWECSYDRFQYSSNYYYRGDERGSIVGLVIEFPAEVQLNRVIVHTINSAEYPSSDYGTSDVGLRYAAADDIWVPVDLVGRQTKYRGRIEGNRDGVINFIFQSAKTRAIKLLVGDTNDAITITSDSSRRIRKGTVRLIEIEAYGSEKIATPPAADDLDGLLKEESEEDAKVIF